MIKILETNFNYPFFLHVQLVDRGSSSVGRAIPCQGIGREFEPRLPLQSNRVWFRTGTVAGWQSGDAAACKAVNAGSIPAPAFCIKFRSLLTIYKKGVVTLFFLARFVWEVCFENFNHKSKGWCR